MFNQFKKGEEIIVCGFGEECGKFYYQKRAIIKERDPYYKDYLVKFKDGSEDWIISQYLHKPYTKKKGEHYES